jgi:DNA repair protein RadC
MEKRTTFNPLKVAEVTIAYSTKVKATERPVISSSRDAAAILKFWWDKGNIEFVEEFKVLLLNRANRVLGIRTISTGGVSGTVADPKLIFVSALKANASCLILSHSHPSGNLKPSEADLKLTKKVARAGEFLEIKVLDHIIITKDSFYSLADNCQM